MPSLVAIDLPGGPAFVTALMAVWEAGDAALPIDQRIPAAAKEQLLELMAPAAVLRPGIREVRAGGVPVEPGDALVVPTSGTTGKPKGVVLTHDAVAASAAATSRRLGVDPTYHRWLACLPLNHVGGLSVVTRAILTGTPLAVLPGFEEGAVRAASGPEVLVSLVSTTLRRLDARLFHTVVIGGSAPPDGLAANVVTTYGMTETGSGVVYDGLPLECVEVAIGAADEIRLRGPMLLRAYRDGTVPLDRDGWMTTGDAGRLDPDGRLEVHGRLTDVIITGGEHVWPAAVEAVLRRHPGVVDVAVGGRPDPEWGERVVAWVVAGAETPTLEGLRNLVKDRLVPWAAPRELVLVRSLPRSSIGKINTNALGRGPR